MIFNFLRRSNYKLFLLSFVLHIIFFSVFFIFKFISRHDLIPSPILNASIYSSAEVDKTLSSIKEETTTKNGIYVSHHPVKSSQFKPAHFMQSDKNKEIKFNPLLKLLHNAIAAVQQYPESALALKQTGTVKIGFRLYPNGTLTQVTMLKSSGVDSLDLAALQAIQRLPSISEVGTYLKKENFFSIDVVFS